MISVIVPFYNAAPWIEHCSRALLEQRYAGDWEILLVDNNSNDGSKARIPRDPRLRVLEETVQGSYSARNLGVRESRGEILAFTDADSIAAPDWLSKIEHAMRNPRTQVVLGSREAAAAGTIALIAAYDDARVRYIFEGGHSRSYFGYTGNMAVRRAAFVRYGPFETEPRGGDTLFLRRVSEGEGAASAIFDPAIRVRHLELESAWAYVHKNFLYARARMRTRHLGQCERLSLAECIRVFRGVTQGRPRWQQVSLALALSAGRLSWRAGSML